MMLYVFRILVLESDGESVALLKLNTLKRSQPKVQSEPDRSGSPILFSRCRRVGAAARYVRAAFGHDSRSQWSRLAC